MNEIIYNRVQALRDYLKEHGLNAFIFPSTDPHLSEYTPEYWKLREWISGFNGSAGTAVVTTDDAALWTDSRYFIAAAEQLSGTPFKLMRERLPDTPSIEDWLASVLPQNSVVGIDGHTITAQGIDELSFKFGRLGLKLKTAENPADTLWKERPPLPDAFVCVQPQKYAGRSVGEKLSLIRSTLQQQKADGLLLSALDEIAWVLNMRGSDVKYTPVFVAFMFIGCNACTLYINRHKLSDAVRAHLDTFDVNVKDYDDVYTDLASLSDKCLWIDWKTTNSALYQCAEHCALVNLDSPVAMMKAVKCSSEIDGYKRAMVRDGVAMVKFLKWLKPAVKKGGLTELGAVRRLLQCRCEQEHFLYESFETIAGYAAHGAVVHYEPTLETDIELRQEGLFLIDSGGQYEDGTTDITRTIALGPTSYEAKRDYTLVLKGHILLANVKFPEGSSGTQLDICARYAMWQQGINYLHGSGHGVGSRLCVHEGPHQLRMNYMPAPLLPYMTLTNEPGIYREGRHGARIENTQIILPYMETEFGKFLQFEPLTLCPIDTEPIVLEMLTGEEIKWLNDYHEKVYNGLFPFLDVEHREWLAQATRPI